MSHQPAPPDDGLRRRIRVVAKPPGDDGDSTDLVSAAPAGSPARIAMP